MARKFILLFTAASGLALGGCVAGLVASAAGTAIQSARGQPQSNAQLQPAARAACSGRAAQYGSVHIIDIVQSSINRIVVWGSVDDGKQRRSFECGFTTAISYFRLRDIKR